MRSFITVTLATLAFLAVAAPSASAATPAQCAPPGAETVLRTPKVVIVHRTNYEKDHEKTWGCLAPRWKRFLILKHECYSDQGCTDLPPAMAVAGKYVAYIDGGCVKAECGASVGIVSLRTGRRGGGFSTGFASRGPVVTERGTAAWIDVGEFPQGGTYVRGTRVVTMGFEGPSTTLDVGDDIDPESLALGGSTLYWTRAGAPRSATLR